LKNFVIVHTGSGGSYARHIASSLRWISRKKRVPVTALSVAVNGLAELMASHPEFTPNNTVICARAAYPSETGWMKVLYDLQDTGYTIVNKPEVLRLTSDKLTCSLKLQEVIAHPKTWKVNQGEDPVVPAGKYVAKPITSMEQGARVIIVERIGDMWYCEPEDNPTLDFFTGNLGNPFVLQEYVPYVALHRVIVIGGVALPYSFQDRREWHPDSWKVSVCLNRTSMKFVPNPSAFLLTLAERAQEAVGAEISFVDIFETADGYTMSEINTACNLRIHEKLALRAGRSDWNIHYQIAKYLWNKEV
jgi:glutathione synthase/RimK-type ligase-like ATP-grasp enzyme